MPIEMKLRKGIDLIEESVGEGPEIEKQKCYQMGLRIWLNKGDPVTWNSGYGTLDENNPIQMADKAQLMISNFRYDRVHLFNGLFYGVKGMRIGGVRKLRIAPHLAFGEDGVEGLIPANALLVVEVSVMKEIHMS